MFITVLLYGCLRRFFQLRKFTFNENLDKEYFALNFFKETQETIDFLADCNKVAFLVPSTRLIASRRVLRSRGVSKLSVGRELLMERRIGFYLRG